MLARKTGEQRKQRQAADAAAKRARRANRTEERKQRLPRLAEMRRKKRQADAAGNHELDHHADTISRDYWLNAGYQRSHLRRHILYLADHWRSHPCVLSRDRQLRHLRLPGWTLLETGQSDPAENDNHRSVPHSPIFECGTLRWSSPPLPPPFPSPGLRMDLRL
ncbi:hypothetical protein HPB47_013459 [Ixodes persulcatus]|uniref:Uncharacterized protein n=1 Tax=Ixodes persulcatus TaxID=34615 RepID=A0AC60QYG5_IXOPE|nr:hypothetical protein HPB47_013459 [Ixodes persulcatus]